MDRAQALQLLRRIFPNAEVKEETRKNKYTSELPDDHVILAQSKKDGGGTWRIEVQESRQPAYQIEEGPDRGKTVAARDWYIKGFGLAGKVQYVWTLSWPVTDDGIEGALTRHRTALAEVSRQTLYEVGEQTPADA